MSEIERNEIQIKMCKLYPGRKRERMKEKRYDEWRNKLKELCGENFKERMVNESQNRGKQWN